MKLKSKRILIAILAISTVFASCNKDRNETDAQFTNQKDETTLKLVSFRQDLFSKSGGSMPSDSAEWYLEGLLNYEKANNTHEFAEVEFKSDTLTWPAGNGEVSYSDLQNIYASINAMAENMALQSGNPDYTFDVIDLQVIETGLKNGEQAIALSLSGGVKGTTPTHVAFGPDDYWFYGDELGKCGDFSGHYIGRDATTELEKQFMLAKTDPSYYVSIVTVLAPAIYYETTDNPYGNYMMWAQNGTESICLSPGELNYYLSKFEYIKNINKPENKSFATVNVVLDFINGKRTEYIHEYSLKYGINIGCPIN